MKQYQSKKKVDAEPMTSTEWMEFRNKLKDGGFSDATLEADLAGYAVVYNPCTDKEYWSWSPKDVFEDGYDEIERKSNPLQRVTRYA